MNEIWPEIVKRALARGIEASKGAVPGAKLRQIIARIAPEYNEQYPPLGHEDEKFRDFLGHFGSLVNILQRTGQDILVAPSDKPELLNDPESGQAQLRDDIFEAFTHIPQESPPKVPWYERSTDKIAWKPADAILEESAFAKIPPATLDQELEDRRAFARSSEIDPEISLRLLGTGDDHAALWSFSKLVKENGLAHKWHFFRFRSLVMRIRRWCESEHIEWHEDWLRSRSYASNRPTLPDFRDAISQQHRFEGFLEGLSSEDIKRISVPLDIVLKLFQK